MTLTRSKSLPIIQGLMRDKMLERARIQEAKEKETLLRDENRNKIRKAMLPSPCRVSNSIDEQL